MARRKTKVIDGEVCVIARWTSHCTGCFESGEYGELEHLYEFDLKAKCWLGSGCHECGYQGKRRWEMWVPVASMEPPEPRTLARGAR